MSNAETTNGMPENTSVDGEQRTGQSAEHMAQFLLAMASKRHQMKDIQNELLGQLINENKNLEFGERCLKPVKKRVAVPVWVVTSETLKESYDFTDEQIEELKMKIKDKKSELLEKQPEKTVLQIRKIPKPKKGKGKGKGKTGKGKKLVGKKRKSKDSTDSEHSDNSDAEGIDPPNEANEEKFDQNLPTPNNTDINTSVNNNATKNHNNSDNNDNNVNNSDASDNDDVQAPPPKRNFKILQKKEATPKKKVVDDTEADAPSSDDEKVNNNIQMEPIELCK